MKEGCECFGLKKPGDVIAFTKKINFVRLFGGKSEAGIKRDVETANRMWRKAGISIEANVKSINKSDTEKMLGTDNSGRIKREVILGPVSTALNHPATRQIMGLEEPGKALTVPAAKNRDSAVVYYVPEFNDCAGKDDAVGCALAGELGGRFSIWVEKSAQRAILAHELGHMWGNSHVEKKRNVMFEAPTGTGLNDDQIRTARSTLRLGSMRCGPGGTPTSQRVEREQQRAELNQELEGLLRETSGGSITGNWKGTIVVNGTARETMLGVSPRSLNITYWWIDNKGKKVPGSTRNVRIVEGALKFDWWESREQTGKATLQFRRPRTLDGAWGLGESDSNGGKWIVEKEIEE